MLTDRFMEADDVGIDIGKKQTIEELTGGRIRKQETTKAPGRRGRKPKSMENAKESGGKSG